MSESMTSAELPKVAGWKGLSDAGHFERLEPFSGRAGEPASFQEGRADAEVSATRCPSFITS
ncbi:hypothetical protein HLI18_09365 [Rhizobium laguerreae]|uniref:hypothetical protein n=1 Tax=Rhizobium laguerreae TaxID=1076926 RepID=UPI0014782139|nr:hypothetical protein [Rhizobium laguerreae]NNG70121.1 hypothetical protein [Rhizobium laguerreae]